MALYPACPLPHRCERPVRRYAMAERLCGLSWIAETALRDGTEVRDPNLVPQPVASRVPALMLAEALAALRAPPADEADAEALSNAVQAGIAARPGEPTHSALCRALGVAHALTWRDPNTCVLNERRAGHATPPDPF
ncbi:MAG TPA: hypothetical protein VE684_14400 [Crenalkalicoccus sp.]|jgi:hypothetical protein|nr:hypothetical protein [Crenalkalicoccus sp.]